MRVVLLSYEYPPDTGFGGIGTYTWYQARALARAGHQVRVIAGSLRPGTFHSEHDGVRVTRVLDDGSLRGAIEGLGGEGLGWAPIRLRNAAGAFGALRDLLEHEPVDVVEYPECGGDGTVVSTMLPVPTCVRFHSPAPLIMRSYGADDRDVETTTLLEQIAINQADVRTAPSSFLAEEVGTSLAVPPPVHVIPNGIDLEHVDRVPGVDVADRFSLPGEGAVTVMFSSRLERRKGAHLLPAICREVLRRYPHVHVILAGADEGGVVDQQIRPALEDDRHAARLHVLGRLPLDEVRHLLKHVDIHLLPSLWDNAPYSCLEAMAASRAVLSSDCGGMPEMVEHDVSGLLATTGDAASFAAGLSRLVEDGALRERLGGAARRRVEERYTDVIVADRTVEVWRAALAPAPPPWRPSSTRGTAPTGVDPYHAPMGEPSTRPT